MKIGAIALRIVKQFLRDKRSLALLVVAPVLVLTLIWLVLDGNDYKPIIAVNDMPTPIEEALENELGDRLLYMTETEVIEAFQDGALDAFLSIEDQSLKIWFEGSDPLANSSVQKTVQSALKALNHPDSLLDMKTDYYYGAEDLVLFDQIGTVLIGFLVFFFVFIIGGISFLRERTSGTLEKLMSTPIKRWQIVTGYLFGFGLFTVIQSLIIVLFSVYVLDIWTAGSIWQILIVTFLLALSALTLATFLSAYANNEFQMMQFIPLVIIPQVFFSGIFHLEAKWLQVLSKFMPLTYGADALQQMMIKGKGIWEVWPSIVTIIGFACFFFILNIFALKKYRKL